MELSVNLFNKGLQMDTHPMVLGNDTLSDCLNGTMITMSGNEVILQNDMGNRRVDNAFLPPGYEPVGMKEYGGVIYIAAYNPITNRSLIGSFPSPERKIDSLDDKNLGCNFELFKHFYSDSNETIKFIDSDTVLLPLTSDVSLHAGDKFTIYSSNIENWKGYLTNYNNTNSRTKKIKSPKNNYITLFVGILNSQNQFVDITKTLKRWNNSSIPSKELKYDNTYSENYIFNDGYFISNSKLLDESSYSLSDKALIKERQLKPANTYAYKLVGPLYLKAQLNHILEFSFNIVGNKISDDNITNRIELIITANILYNCPDGGSGLGNPLNDEYLNDGCGQIQGYWEAYSNNNNTIFKLAFDFYIYLENRYVKLNLNNIQYSTPVYNSSTLLYKTTVTASCNIDNYNNDILKYFIGVDSGIPLSLLPSNESYYILSLSSYGELNINKLGTGEIKLKSFRFYNEDNSTTITYSIESYPKIGLKFSNMELEFTDVSNASNSIIINEDNNGNYLPVYNGRNIISFNWDKIEPRKLYIVKFSVWDSTSEEIRKLGLRRWFLSTKLFNDCYSPQSSKFVEDFGMRVTASSPLYDKLKVKLKVVLKEINNDEDPITTKLGKLIEKGNQPEKIKYRTITAYSTNRKIQDNVYIDNEELYPDFIKLVLNNLEFSVSEKSDVSISLIKNDSNGSNKEIKTGYNSFDNWPFVLIVSSIKDNKLEVKTLCTNFIYSEPDQNKEFKNGFVKINSSDFKEKVLGESVSHSGFFVSNRDSRGGDDSHYIGFISDNVYVSKLLRKASDFYNLSKRKIWKKEEEQIVNFNDETISSIYESMSSCISPRYTFAYIFSASNIVGRVENGDTSYRQPLSYVLDFYAANDAGIRGNDSGFCPITACKVWWRNGESDYWVLLNSETGIFGDLSNSSQLKFPITHKVTVNNDDKNLFFYVCPEDIPSNDDGIGNYNNKKLGGELYEAIYNGEKDDALIAQISENTITYDGVTYDYFPNNGLDGLVKDQIMNFLDPDKKIVYNLYSGKGKLSDHLLYTISKNNSSYNLPYSGNITINIIYNSENSELLSSSNLSILPFYKPEYSEIEGFKEGRLIIVPIKSYEGFEDEIMNILNNNIISNIYLENGVSIDINNNFLSENTIYKEEGGNLIPVNDPPYRVYNIGDYNSLISTKNYKSASSGKSKYLRVSGDEDSRTALEFSGGELRTVDYNKFKNL